MNPDMRQEKGPNIHGAPRTFASVYDAKRNNFDCLRFGLASLVIWSHCFPLAGHPMDWFYALSGQIDGGSLAVDGFFILSGFLVTQSWMNVPKVSIFASKRLLRIVPALLAALALGGLIIGPLNSSLSVGGYFESREPWTHFLGVVFNRYLALPSVFATNPLPNMVNAPLWSLRYEILCYAGVALLGLSRARTWSASIVAVFAVSWLTFLVYRQVVTTAGLPPMPETIARLTACFSAGMLFYVFRARVPYRRDLAILAALVALATFFIGGFHGALPIAGGYLLLYAAFSPALPFSRFGRYGDFSYGLYVFAYPIQQAIVRNLGAEMSVATFFALSVLLTLPLAVVSWHLIEAPALSLKPRNTAPRAAAVARPPRDANVATVVAARAANRDS